MASEPTERVALMAIHPRYAEAILDGRKMVEFRKRRPAADIRQVLIYATAPVSAIIGSFDVGDVVVDAPDRIWSSYGEVGVINRADYDSYFAASDAAVAIEVGGTRRFVDPVPLSALAPPPAVPQSFSYLRREELTGV